MELDKNKIIKKIDLKKKSGLYMCGPAYLNANDSSLLRRYLEKYIETKDIGELYWEDILLENIEEFKIYGKILGRRI